MVHMPWHCWLGLRMGATRKNGQRVEILITTRMQYLFQVPVKFMNIGGAAGRIQQTRAKIQEAKPTYVFFQVSENQDSEKQESVL